jgi:membrane-associated protein
MQLHPLLSMAIFFAIIFSESAFFPLAPFLPGDALLFGIGVLAANGLIKLEWILPVLIVAGVLGNWVAYLLGLKYSDLIFSSKSWFKQSHFEQAKKFYAKNGSIAFLGSRFVPVIRSLVPLVAGLSKMKSSSFFANNVFSVAIWVISVSMLAFFLGEMAFVKHHADLIIFGVTITFLLGVLFWGARNFLHKNRKL